MNKNDKTTFIIGHRNPDADSVISAYAYGYLKNQLGYHSTVAKRCGNVNGQTDYLFMRFNQKLPDFIPDLIPKVKYFAQTSPATFNENESLWAAVGKMADERLDYLSLVDNEGTYQSFLYYESFAHYLLKQANPKHHASIKTSIDLIKRTLNAQALNLYNETAIMNFSLLSSESYSKTVKERLDQENPGALAIIMGDRFDLQRYAIEAGCRLLIISNGHLLQAELRDLAIKNHVSVLVSPYDSVTTSMMILYSIPVKEASDKKIEAVERNDLLKKARMKLTKSPARALPVINRDKKVVAILTESDLIKEPNIDVIMVDHNEFSQAIEGIEHYRILEVIDHHRIGGFSSTSPITFLNRVVGSTCSIISSLFREYHVAIPKEIAALLLGGLISDTLALKSATATPFDHQIAEYLTIIAELDFDQFSAEVLQAANQTTNKTAEEIVAMDLKVYKEESVSYSISQIETNDVNSFIEKRRQFLDELELVSATHLFSALLITDVTSMSSYFFIVGNSSFINQISYPKVEDHVYLMKGILSRKKQLIPLISSMIQSFLLN